MKTDHGHRHDHRLAHALRCFWLVRPLPKNHWLLRRLSSPLILHFYIVVSEYGKDGADAEIVLLKSKGKIDVRSTSVADFIRENILGRFYKLVSMGGRVSILLGCLHASRAVSFCFSFSHVARYAPSCKTKTYGTIAANTSQANL